jgi:hypothetical protein
MREAVKQLWRNIVMFAILLIFFCYPFAKLRAPCENDAGRSAIC